MTDEDSRALEEMTIDAIVAGFENKGLIIEKRNFSSDKLCPSRSRYYYQIGIPPHLMKKNAGDLIWRLGTTQDGRIVIVLCEVEHLKVTNRFDPYYVDFISEFDKKARYELARRILVLLDHQHDRLNDWCIQAWDLRRNLEEIKKTNFVEEIKDGSSCPDGECR